MIRSVRSVLIVAAALLLAVAGPFNDSSAATLTVGGTGGALGVMRELGAAFTARHRDIKIVVVPGLGSSGARKALLAGALDLGVTSRAGPSIEKTDGALVYGLGGSPFVIAVSKQNPVVSIKLQDLVEIYSGVKNTWPNGERLRLILRPETDSDSDVLKSMSPGMVLAVQKAHKRDGLRLAVTDEECASAIESTPGAVGSSILSLILSENRGLKGLVIDGSAPTLHGLAAGSYPWFKSFYILTRDEPPPPVRTFIEFVFSGRGREIISSSGYWLPPAKEAR